MRSLPTLLVLAALAPPLAWLPPAAAQGSAPQSLAQAERNAVNLRQGMSLEEVQKLLGKPRRTALKTNGLAASDAPQGMLQWSYSWAGASSSQGSLQVVFAAKAREEWFVTSWEWATY